MKYGTRVQPFSICIALVIEIGSNTFSSEVSARIA
ncbi:uncharacterized protein METZ01_LOCUS515559, partial [marine metagenome]